MDYFVSASGNLNCCPCTVVCVDDQMFVIGCYELISTREENADAEINKNGRCGSLVLVKNETMVTESACIDGGVFDLRMISNTESPFLCAAHSNGALAFYKIEKDEIIFLKRIDTGRTLLCSISVSDSKEVIFVGDSNSKLISVHCNLLSDSFSSDSLGSDSTVTRSISSSEDPIWSIHDLTIGKKKNLVMVGSDDCLLRMFLFENGCFSECLKILKEATGGVTSIATILRQNNEHETLYDLFTGSYDEHIRVYGLVIRILDEGEVLVKVEFKSSVRLNGSGIWRMIPCSESDKLFLVAAMFGGAFIIDKSFSFYPLPIPEAEAEAESVKLESEQKPLVYGIASDRSINSIVVSLFYQRKFIILSKGSQN